MDQIRESVIKNLNVRRAYDGSKSTNQEQHRSQRLVVLALELKNSNEACENIEKVLVGAGEAAINADVRPWKNMCLLNIAFAKMALGMENTKELDKALGISLVVSGYDGLSPYDRIKSLATIAKLQEIAGQNTKECLEGILETAWVFEGVSNGMGGYYSYPTKEYCEKAVETLKEEIELLKRVRALSKKKADAKVEKRN